MGLGYLHLFWENALQIRFYDMTIEKVKDKQITI